MSEAIKVLLAVDSPDDSGFSHFTIEDAGIDLSRIDALSNELQLPHGLVYMKPPFTVEDLQEFEKLVLDNERDKRYCSSCRSLGQECEEHHWNRTLLDAKREFLINSLKRLTEVQSAAK